MRIGSSLDTVEKHGRALAVPSAAAMTPALARPVNMQTTTATTLLLFSFSASSFFGRVCLACRDDRQRCDRQRLAAIRTPRPRSHPHTHTRARSSFTVSPRNMFLRYSLSLSLSAVCTLAQLVIASYLDVYASARAQLYVCVFSFSFCYYGTNLPNDGWRSSRFQINPSFSHCVLSSPQNTYPQLYIPARIILYIYAHRAVDPLKEQQEYRYKKGCIYVYVCTRKSERTCRVRSLARTATAAGHSSAPRLARDCRAARLR